MEKNERNKHKRRYVLSKMTLNKDTGLSKKGLQEVQNIVSDSIQTLKDDFDKRFDDMKFDTEKKWDNMGEFKAKVYRHFEHIEKTLLGIEFKYNWKTALWVFIGSATPVTIGIVLFFLKVNG